MPATTPTGTYKDTLWGKIGKSLDFKDSFVSKTASTIKESIASIPDNRIKALQAGNQLTSLTGDELNLIGTGTMPTGKSAVPDLESLYMAEPPAQAYPVSIPGTGTRTPFVGGPGIGSDSTSAWESVGEVFPVSSPDLVGNIGEGYSRSVPYDYQSIASKRQRDLLNSLRLQNRLFGE